IAPAVRSAIAAHSRGNPRSGAHTGPAGVIFAARPGSFRLGEERADLRLHEVDRDEVVSAFGDDEIRVALRRLDELEVHRANARLVLTNDLIQGAASLGDVALESPDETDVRIGVDVDLDVHQVPEARVLQDQKAVE